VSFILIIEHEKEKRDYMNKFGRAYGLLGKYLLKRNVRLLKRLA
jgi:hypothetical protein